MYKLFSVFDQVWFPGFDVCVFPFRNYGLGGIGSDCDVAEVCPFQVSAPSIKIETIIIALPTREKEIFIFVGCKVFTVNYFHILILESGSLDAVELPAWNFKYIQIAFWPRFSWHLVFVCFKFWPW